MATWKEFVDSEVPPSTAKPNFVVTLFKRDSPVRLGMDRELVVSIRNESNVDYDGGRLSIRGDTYHSESSVGIPRIRKYGECRVTLVAHVKGGVQYEDIPYSIALCIDGERHAQFLTSMGEFTGTLRELFPKGSEFLGTPERFNILVFGIAGATKTSFINAAKTLLADDGTVKHELRAGGSVAHNTKELVKVPLDGTSVALWDTWGLTNRNYTGEELQCFLNGDLPSGWNMDLRLVDQMEALRFGAATRWKRRMHSVLFFMPQAALMDANLEQQRELIRQNFQCISDHGMNPILVVSLVDELDKSIRNDPSSPSKMITDVMDRASLELNIPRNRIKFCLNYTNETKPNAKIGRNTLEILALAVQAAVDYCEFRSNTRATIDSSSGRTVAAFDWD